MKPYEQLPRELTRILGERWSDTAANRLLYSRDMSAEITLKLRDQSGDPNFAPMRPHVVCWPEDAHEVVKLVKLANRLKIPIVPFGGGSGVVGGTIPVRGGMIIDLKRMDKILKLNNEQGTADIETGMLGWKLEAELNRTGYTLHFPTPARSATLGGYLAARSADVEDRLEEAEVVTPRGELIRFGRHAKLFPKIRTKDLFVGTEGTCGIITKARLKIQPLPPAECYRGISFNRLESGLMAMRLIIQANLRPTVLHLHDPLSLLFEHSRETSTSEQKTLMTQLKQGGQNWLLQHPRMTTLLNLLPLEVILIVGFAGEKTFISEQEKIALSLCQKVIARDLGPGPGEQWKQQRHHPSFMIPQLFDEGGFMDTIEVATTWDLLEGLYQKITRALQHKVCLMAHFSHATPDSCAISFTFAGKTGSYEQDLALYQEVWQEAMETCLLAGGTISHQHGIGLLKAPYLERELENCMKVFKAVKKKLDPAGIMNPGKMSL